MRTVDGMVETREQITEQLRQAGLSEAELAYLSERRLKNLESGRTSVAAAVKALRKQRRREEKARRKHGEPLASMEDVRLYCRDVREDLSDVLADESVDFIITDPPYPHEYLPLMSDLGALARRVLKPGGLLIVMAGQSYLPEVMRLLSSELDYHWTSAYLTPGGQAVQLWQRRVVTFWKPLLIFSKGRYEGDWFGDVCRSDVNNNDKRFHGWGQSVSGMASILDKHTYPGDVILDPFVGGGATGVVCAQMGRRFIGIDNDPNCIETTRRRIEEVVGCRK